jgi:ubiquinone/menaquinone biosynthesis C-methylase UbiE
MRPVTDTAAVLRLFDELAGEYDQHIPFFASFGRDLSAWCDLRPGQRVLDIAAGRGAVAGPAAQAVGPRGAVLAIDGSPNMLRALARDFGDVPQMETREMDAHRLAFPDASFDVVTCGLAFHIMHDPERAISEALRVLRPGGLLAFSTAGRWDFDELVRDVDERASEERKRRSSEETAPELLTPPPRALPEICAAVGFTDVEQRTVQRSFDFRDPQHYWDHMMSHGFRSHVDSLGPQLADEFRTRLFAALEQLQADGCITASFGAVFARARKPGVGQTQPPNCQPGGKRAERP